MIDSQDIQTFCDNPTAFFDRNCTKLQTASAETYAELQLEGLKHRFSQLRDAIPMVKKLADKQDVSKITALDDVVPLLFAHTMYKSYPASFLEKNRFDQLTRWLNKLTTYDLSGVDASECNSIDQWMMKLDAETPLRICHTSGTSGTFSFIPRAKSDWERFVAIYPVTLLQQFGDESSSARDMPLNMHTIIPFYRSGGLSHTVITSILAEMVAGTEERLHTLFPGRFSSDITFLSARMRAAQAAGKLDRLQVSDELLARRDEFIAEQASMPEQVSAFFQRMSTELAGESVFMQATTPQLLQIAQAGLETGVERVFAPDSIILTGGGGKGMVLPDDWQDIVKRFFGADNLFVNFGMTEMCASFPLCSEGRYHLMPWIICYLLDPDSSEPLPREGEVTGRLAFYDLIPDTRWGGFITGDEVTIDWDTPCACGRTTPHMHSHIQRFSEKTGEEDKISCAATPEAYNEAMDFLTGTAGN